MTSRNVATQRARWVAKNDSRRNTRKVNSMRGLALTISSIQEHFANLERSLARCQAMASLLVPVASMADP